MGGRPARAVGAAEVTPSTNADRLRLARTRQDGGSPQGVGSGRAHGSRGPRAARLGGEWKPRLSRGSTGVTRGSGTGGAPAAPSETTRCRLGPAWASPLTARARPTQTGTEATAAPGSPADSGPLGEGSRTDSASWSEGYRGQSRCPCPVPLPKPTSLCDPPGR